MRQGPGRVPVDHYFTNQGRSLLRKIPQNHGVAEARGALHSRRYAQSMKGSSMSETPNSAGNGPDEPVGSSRQRHRNRNLVIIGAIALVLVAGTTLVGSLTSGGRSGTVTSIGTGDSCFVVQKVSWNGGTVDPEMTWENASDAAAANGGRLPTIAELEAMLANRSGLNVSGNYWSSETDGQFAYHMDLSAGGTGEKVNLVKNGTLHVRPVGNCIE